MATGIIQTWRNSRRGFSLLEMTLALSVGGIMMGAIWQLMGTQGQTREAMGLASQAYAVAQAGQSYINANSTTLLALTQLNAINNVARIKITASDTGDTTTNVQDAGYLPSSFSNNNSFGQSYALYVQRQDGGTAGVDASDRLVGLLVTSGGATISDDVGSRAAAGLGAAGGFIRAGGNTASGTAGGWSINFSSATGWSTTPGTSGATAGHLAVLTALLVNAPSMGSGGSGASSIDQLSDGITDYSSLYNVFLGKEAGASATGAYNTATGYRALYSDTTGRQNSAFGSWALNSNTTGNSNTAISSQALYSNTTGGGNTALGYQALYSNTTAISNSAMGLQALYSNTTGANNTATGYQALYKNTTGPNNAAFGYLALYSNTTGSGNTATGYQALANNSTGIGSAALGYNALYSASTGGYNTGLGYQAGQNVTTGANNTIIGYNAAASLTTGTYNIVIGSGVDAPSATGTALINIGNLIYGDITNGRVGFASSSSISTSGISFDMGSRTDSARLAVGTTAQRPTCSASLEGAQRWNSQTQTVEICGGGVWLQPTPAWTSVGNTPPTPPTGSGFLVLTAGTWDANLGGLTGANAKCLSDLTANDWLGKATAVANGQLTSSKVEAFIWYVPGDTPYRNFSLPDQTTYYVAVSGNPAVGGANMTSYNNGWGTICLPYACNEGTPQFSGANYFNGYFRFWYGNKFSYSTGEHSCSSWTSNSAASTGYYRDSTQTNGYIGCDTLQHLICIVHP